jgi:hypothetical protein
MRCNIGGSTYKKWGRGVAVITHTVSYESTHSCYHIVSEYPVYKYTHTPW